MADDEHEGIFGGLYENGHWTWDENEKGLVYVSDLPPQVQEEIHISHKAPTGTIEFRDDVDLIEQIRFRRRYQRKLKPGQPDIITLQDVKDIALYTAPVNILSPTLIDMLHLPTTERFIRTLIFFCQYYLQVDEEMNKRIQEMQTKMRTPYCNVLEREFANNLADLRLLIAKEYCTMIIELEVNRIFKSEAFNLVEHRLKTCYIAKMSDEQRSVLLGHCVRHDRKLKACSPLINEVICDRHIDYKLFGLGVIKYKRLSPSLRYMMLVATAPEDVLSENDVVLGIIGLSRAKFDTMLRPIHIAAETESKSASSLSKKSFTNKGSSSKKIQSVAIQLYPEVRFPPKDKTESALPSSFPHEPEVQRPCSETQRLRWQKRLQRILHPQTLSH